MLNESQRAALEALCDTIVPSIERDDDPHGHWSRKASDLMIAAAVEDLIAQIPDEVTRGGMLQLLDILDAQGLGKAPSQESREQILRNISFASPDGAAGVNALVAMTLFLYYGAPDPQTGSNPNWATFGYPGPTPASNPPEKLIQTTVPEDGQVIEADAVVVGSGSGGGVIAAQLARDGRKVVVIEAGGYFNEADFTGLELQAYQEMFWRGGPTPTGDMNVSLQAGTTLGGGTTINWTNCLRTKDAVREEWAQEHGLEGVDTSDYDRHLDAVLERIGATDQASDLNEPQKRMKEGADKLGWHFSTVIRNADLDKYSYETAGHLGFGDASGAKLSGEKTWLRDAFDNGAEFLVRTRAQRVLTENGAAAGVEAVYMGDDLSEQRAVTVRAPLVVVACGALESPALLLRSGIGGPAVGRNLRLHPCTAVGGQYESETRAWWGAPQAALVDEYTNVDDGYGFLIESTQYGTGTAAAATPFVSGADHKQAMSELPLGATFIGLVRDHGAGQVTIDEAGQAVPTYALTDARDVRNSHRALDAQVRLHVAAGARRIAALAAGVPTWRVGDDVDRYVERLKRVPLGAGGFRLFAAHQMGSCRMGGDPQTSVANPYGELHDTPGVWIGDASAFPTSSGTNPMITIMALAHRTGEAILTTSPAAAPGGSPRRARPPR